MTTNPRVIHELKEAQVEGQFLLRDSPMGSQPRTQQGPEALHRVDMNLIETLPVFIAGVFTPAMADGVMIKTPSRQGGVDFILIGMDPRSWGDKRLDEWTDRHLLDILQHPNHHGASALNHAENGRFFLLQGPTPPCALQSPPPPLTAFFFTAAGNPL